MSQEVHQLSIKILKEFFMVVIKTEWCYTRDSVIGLVLPSI